MLLLADDNKFKTVLKLRLFFVFLRLLVLVYING